MPFEIVFNNISGLAIYAILFSASDPTKAWKTSISNFDTFLNANQSPFALLMVENSERKGWYNYTISDTTNIPSVSGDSFYFIEIRQRLGVSPDRDSDPLLGNTQYFWGKQSGDGGASAKEIWEYAIRTLTDVIPVGITPQQIWEYADRTLTQNPCPVEDIKAAILDAIKNLSQQVTNENSKQEQHIDEVNTNINISIQKSEQEIISEMQKLLTPTPPPQPVISNPVVKPKKST